MNRPSKIKLIMTLIFVQILFGINFVSSKFIVNHIVPIDWAILRFLLAFIFLFFMMILNKKKLPPMTVDFWLRATLIGLLSIGLGQTLFLIGIKKTSPINAAIITSGIPIFTLFFSLIKKEEPWRVNKLIGIILSFVGVLGVKSITEFNFQNDTFLGDLLILSGCLSLSLSIVLSRQFFIKYDQLSSTTFFFFISAMVMMLFFGVPSFNDLVLKISSIPYLASHVLFSFLGATVITYLLSNWIIQFLKPSVVAQFIYIQPVVTMMIGLTFFGDSINAFRIFSLGLIGLGLIISTKLQQKTLNTTNN